MNHHCLKPTYCSDKTRFTCTICAVDDCSAQHRNARGIIMQMPFVSSYILRGQHIELRLLSIRPEIRNYKSNKHKLIY